MSFLPPKLQWREAAGGYDAEKKKEDVQKSD
jgi:hypothetical protein